MINQKYFLLLLFLPLLFSCNRNPLKVDISDIETEIDVVRFEKALFALPQKDTLEALKELREQHPAFFDLFTYKVINIGGIGDSAFTERMKAFLTDTMILRVREQVQTAFSGFDETERSLVKAFKYYQFHFPGKPLPTIYTTISGFNQSVFTAEGIIGISLDKYLGTDCPYYRRLSNVPLYKIRNMHPEKIAADVAYAWGMTEFDATGKTTTVLDNIIHEGKLMYFVDALLPETPDTLKMGYTAEQLRWCKNNEPQMWNYMVENKKLYSNNRMDVVRYINDGPTTTGFPRESPGRAGTWIGWQIVRQYMEKNDTVSVAALMENTDYLQILNESGYYPE